ncbi:MAG TPA: NUDIX hydrolase [Rhodospirillaceae bacterium]|nr:NUDIX hydrolase [Rhodospirillaceae bacterium]
MSVPSPTAPVVGVGAVVWKDGRFLLIRRGRPPRQGSWSLPGGRQELGETVFQTAVREIREETGVAIRVLDIAGVVDLIDRDGDDILYHYTVIDVLAVWLSGDAVAGDDAMAVAWVEPGQLDDYGATEAVRRVVATAGKRLAELGGAPA